MQGDLTHPSLSRVYKAASQLLAFFKTDPTAPHASLPHFPDLSPSRKTLHAGQPEQDLRQ